MIALICIWFSWKIYKNYVNGLNKNEETLVTLLLVLVFFPYILLENNCHVNQSKNGCIKCGLNSLKKEFSVAKRKTLVQLKSALCGLSHHFIQIHIYERK